MLTNRHRGKSAPVGGSSHGRRGLMGGEDSGGDRVGAGGDRAGSGVNDASGRSGAPGFSSARIRGEWSLPRSGRGLNG